MVQLSYNVNKFVRFFKVSGILYRLTIKDTRVAPLCAVLNNLTRQTASEMEDWYYPTKPVVNRVKPSLKRILNDMTPVLTFGIYPHIIAALIVYLLT